MLTKLLKILVPLALLAFIPIAWWWSLDHLEGKRAIVVSSGASLFGIGVAYKMLGSYDLIPDWIPILGGIDDKFAWLVMMAGAAIIAVGYYVF